ncbi:hypothetical protein A6A06_02875 [Streptomyces sp. CB02923]|nr:hypothetical protein A6A06_02875 [Streptomyces sp. CB02923]
MAPALTVRTPATVHAAYTATARPPRRRSSLPVPHPVRNPPHEENDIMNVHPTEAHRDRGVAR